jgi:hypothetical protein
LANIDIFYGHWETFRDILYILWPFGTVCIRLVHFFRICVTKNLATLPSTIKTAKEEEKLFLGWKIFWVVLLGSAKRKVTEVPKIC